jgi:hypothetical protein
MRFWHRFRPASSLIDGFRYNGGIDPGEIAPIQWD